MIYKAGTDEFEMTCDMLDVTSMHRPDTDWRSVDKQGHAHRWRSVDKQGHAHRWQPETPYRPYITYSVTTLKWVFEYWGYYEDGERYEVGHHECRECGEHLEPRYTADTVTQHIPGMRHYRINGESVSEEEFRRRIEPLQPNKS